MDFDIRWFWIWILDLSLISYVIWGLTVLRLSCQIYKITIIIKKIIMIMLTCLLLTELLLCARQFSTDFTYIISCHLQVWSRSHREFEELAQGHVIRSWQRQHNICLLRFLWGLLEVEQLKVLVSTKCATMYTLTFLNWRQGRENSLSNRYLF